MLGGLLCFLFLLVFEILDAFGNRKNQCADEQREYIFPESDGHKRESTLQEGNKDNEGSEQERCNHCTPKYLVVGFERKYTLFA